MLEDIGQWISRHSYEVGKGRIGQRPLGSSAGVS